jgi:hypothetical protein
MDYNNDVDDTDINNYTIDDLMDLVDLEENELTQENVKTEIEKLKQKTIENQNEEMYNFLMEVEKKLLNYVEYISKLDLDVRNYNYEELLLLYNIQNRLPTEEEIINKTEEYVKKFKLNGDDNMIDFFESVKTKLLKLLKEQNRSSDIIEKSNAHYIKINQLMVLNTEFLTNNNTNSTNFLFNLSDTLYDVTALMLHSVSVPYTWYLIDSSYGTNMFEIIKNGITQNVEITEGNYNPSTLADEVNSKLQSIGSENTCVYNTINGKITITLEESISKIIFYDDSFANSKVNNNLGYILGYREESYTSPNIDTDAVSEPEPQAEPEPEPEPESIVTYSITSESPCNTSGTKYLQIYLNDFQRNRQNSVVFNPFNTRDTNLESRFNFDTPLTSTQICALVKKEEDSNIELPNRTQPPGFGDLFATFNINTNNLNVGDTINIRPSELVGNQRNYFSPVNLFSFSIRLLDDKGNILNLNNNDWCLTMNCERQYNNPN